MKSYWVEKGLVATFEEAEEEESCEEAPAEVVEGERMGSIARGMGPPGQLALRPPPRSKGKADADESDGDDHEDDGQSEDGADPKPKTKPSRAKRHQPRGDDEEPELEDIAYLHFNLLHSDRYI